MNVNWKDINKKLIQIRSFVKRNIKKNYKEYYKQMSKNKWTLTFIIFYCYWLHKKCEISIKEILNLLNNNSVISQYLNFIFNNKNLKISFIKDQDVSFLKHKLFSLIKNNSSTLINAIFKSFKKVHFNISKDIHNQFVNLYLYFIMLNSCVSKISSNFKDNLNNLNEYNENVDVYIYSLEQYKKARDLFEQLDRDNLADMTVVMTILSKDLLS